MGAGCLCEQGVAPFQDWPYITLSLFPQLSTGPQLFVPSQRIPLELTTLAWGGWDYTVSSELIFTTGQSLPLSC